MLELLTATRFEKVMSSGRTQPCLLVCENQAGEEIEVVAKLRGHPQINMSGLLSEAVSSLLALDLDLPVQTPYRIAIEKVFADTVPDAALRAILQKSEGLNFACAKWAPGYNFQSIPMEWNGETITGEKIKTYLTESIANFKHIRLQLESVI